MQINNFQKSSMFVLSVREEEIILITQFYESYGGVLNMRLDGNNVYDKKGEEKWKWNYRYTMITILLVLLVIGGAVIVFQNNPQWMAEGNNRNNDITRESRDKLIDGGGIDVVQPIPTVDSKKTPTQKKESPKPDQTGGNFIFPIKGGKVALGYSGDEVVYSKTLDQYVVHQGVDIEASLDTQVLAAAEGTITEVCKDDKLGITIQLTHGNGYITRYSNLSTDKMVEKGDVVKAGDVISGVGNTALFESLEGPHLHFEVWKDGVHVNPEKFVKP
jgi:murein DD-endopeptidase MepM/ murein hydrolase activator NlpD